MVLIKKESKELLVFLHVFKNGGSTVLKLFKELYDKLNKSTLMIQGQGRGATTLDDCYVKEISVKIKKKYKPERVKQFDFIGGHVNLKMIYKVEFNKTILTACSFRCPYSRYISSIIFKNKKDIKTNKEAFSFIKKDMKKKFQLKKYINQYYHNFISSRFDYNKIGKFEESNTRIKQHIDQMSIIIILEKWNDSLDKMKTIFTSDENKNKNEKIIDKYKHIKKNVTKSKTLKTSDILELIKKDKTTWNYMIEVIKYEKEIYDYACQIFNK
jgi:hypothetical protein